MNEKYQGEERRQHFCEKEEDIGKFKEFMASTKGVKATLFTIAFAIILQVGTFLFLWGGLVTTVAFHDKAIEKLTTRLEAIKFVGYIDKDIVQ